MAADSFEAGVRVCCSSGSPSLGSYRGRGDVVELENGLRVYHVGEENRPGVLVAYDIFGFDVGNTRHFCDRLAERGFHVAMPDFFRGEPWPLSDFPPADIEQLKAWKSRVAPWEQVDQDLTLVLPFLRDRGAEGQLGIVGFCWGGRMALKANGPPWGQRHFGAGVSIHAAYYEMGDAERAVSPMMFVKAGDDPSLKPVEEAFQKKPFGGDCVFSTMEDMIHGFCSARGDLSDPNTRKRVDQVLEMTVAFLDKHLNAQ